MIKKMINYIKHQVEGILSKTKKRVKTEG